MIFDNVRTETMNRGDMNAMIAACQLGRDRFLRLVERYGADVVMSAALRLDGLLRADAARRRSRRSPTASTRRRRGWLDDDARNRGVRLRVETKVIVEGDEITIDLTGSNAEVPTGLQRPVRGLAARRRVLRGPHDPARRGHASPSTCRRTTAIFRPVKVIAPKGTIFNPNFPRACFSRFCQVQRVVDNTILALADALPEQVTAGNSAGIHFCSYSGFVRGDGRVLALPRGERGLATAAATARTRWTPSTT